jgi:amino acid adenylation domain-containing protein
MGFSEAIAYCRARGIELRLDGERLKLVGDRAAIDDDVVALVREHKAALIELLRISQDASAEPDVERIDDGERLGLHRCSFNQQRLWFVQQMDSRAGAAGTAYNGGFALTLEGPLERVRLRAALTALLERHESLRTALVEVDGEPWQQLRAPDEAILSEHARVDAAELEPLLRAEVDKPFDLATDALLRAVLFPLADDRHVLLLVTHHVTSDAWSQEILVRDLCTAYVEGSLGEPEGRFQYLDYARWERRALDGARLAAKLAPWRDYLRAAPRMHALPCDFPRSATRAPGRERLDVRLPAVTAARIQAVARDAGTTFFNVMASLYSALVHVLGHRSDVVFGMPVANRGRAEFEAVTGYFSNTAVLRNRLPEDYTLAEALAVTEANMRFVLAHQDVPFDLLVDALKVQRSVLATPLYQLWFSVHEDRRTRFAMGDLAVTAAGVERTQGRYDLKLEVDRQGEVVDLHWEYDDGLFEHASIERFAEYFLILADGFCGDAARRLSELRFDAVDVLAPASTDAVTLWQHALAANPDAPAATSDGATLSYRGLDEASRRLMSLLLELGLAAGDRVALCSERAVDVAVATLALARFGAVCVPLGERAALPDTLAGQLRCVLASPGMAGNAVLGELEIVLLQDVGDAEWLADYAGDAPDASRAGDDAIAICDGDDVLTHGALVRYVDRIGARHGFVAGQRFSLDRGPMSGSGIATLWLGWTMGGCLVDDDRKRPDPASGLANEHEAAAPAVPTGAVEIALQGIWSELLGGRAVGPHDNFFDIGGHSLLATRMLNRVRSRLWPGLELPAIFRHPVLRDLAMHVQAHLDAPLAVPSPLSPIPRLGPADAAPLSSGQRQLWLIDRIEQGSSHYNMLAAWSLRGRLDRAALVRSLGMLFERHAALRTRFVDADGEVMQVVADTATLPLREESHAWLPAATRESLFEERLRMEAAWRFDLATGPLMRVTLVDMGEDETRLVLNIHHAACDGWSIGILASELEALYASATGRDRKPLPSPGIAYRDYAAWQHAWLAGGAADAAAAFWRARLDGAPALHALPGDRPRPAVAGHEGAEFVLRLDAAQLQRLTALARGSGATLFALLHGLFGLLVGRLSATDDVVIGTPVSGRTHDDTEGVVGLFANMLPVRVRLDRGQAFADWLAQVNAEVTESLGQQHYPFEMLVDALRPERSLAYHPVFQIVFAHKLADAKRIALDGVEVTPVPRRHVEAKFDLMLTAVESADGLALEFQYATALFDASSIMRMAHQFAELLRAVCADPQVAIGSACLLPGDERRFLEAHAHGGAVAIEGDLRARFEDTARRFADSPAVSCDGCTLDYAALARAADAVAGRLASLGVAEGDRVLVDLPRGLDLVVGLLAIVRLGAAYVPLDARYPASRLRRMAEDSGARLALCDEASAERLADIGLPRITLAALNALAPAEPPAVPADPERLAYVMYTSGSTGVPKGVAVPHRAILRLVTDCTFVPLDERTRMLLMAPAAFDASTLEFWGPLLNGGRLEIYPEGEADIVALSRFIEEREIDTIWLTAALFYAWAHALDRPLPSLRHVLAGGDVLSPAAVRRVQDHLPDVTVINGYGPTENTTFTCCHRIPRPWPADRPVPIGSPIAGTHVRVLDEQGGTVPVGAIGELYAGGSGVALGYWRNAALTAERFVDLGDGQGRYYRTGDLVRWRNDGSLQYLGRADQQVKIRGYRIELAEIERCLLGVAGVRDAVVVVRDEAERKLVAYYIAAADAPADLGQALRAHAAAELPRFMLPAAFVALPAIPVTANGKVDKRALPVPRPEDHAARAYAPPASPTECALAEVWSSLLGIARVGLDDDFFELGGNSLLAIRMDGAFEAATGRRIPVADVFRLGTLRRIAARCDEAFAASTTEDEVAPVPRDGAMPASFAQQRLWFIDRMDGGSPQYNMPALFELRGALDLDALRHAVDALVARHEVLRTCYREADGVAVQVVRDDMPAAFEHRDFRDVAAGERTARTGACLADAAARAFDLAEGPMIRVHVVQVADEDHRLLFNMHHIASDGWSVGVLVRDLAELYRARVEGRAAALPTLSVQYADYAAWQRRQLAPARRGGALDYWKNQLRDLPQLHELPLDRPRPPRITTRGAVVRSRIRASATGALHALARRHGASLFIVLQSAYALLLARIGGSADIVIGTPVAGRDRPAFEPLVGCFVNTLVLRNEVTPGVSFEQLLEGCRDMVLDAFAHQAIPFDMLVEELNPVRSPNHLPLFQLWFVLQNMEVGTLQLPGLEIAECVRDEVSAKFDLMLSATERDGGIDLNWVYNADLFDPSTIRSWADSYGVLLDAIVAAPATEAMRLEIVGAARRTTLAGHVRGPIVGFPTDTVFAQFAARAAAHPERIAVSCDGRSLRYGELASLADRLAGYLADAGVVPGDRIGLCCGRTLEQVIGLLGAWKAGAAFVPMDEHAPADPLAFMVADAGIAHVLTSAHGADSFDLSQVDVLVLDGAREPGWLEESAGSADRSSATSLAYVIYTSGTTGRPKGVMVDHANLSHLGHALDFAMRQNGMGDERRWAWNAPLVFDAALQAVVQLGIGGELHLLTEQVRTSPALLVDYLVRHGIDVLDGTPGVLEMVVREASLRDVPLPHLLVGGEAIHAGLWRDIAEAMSRAGNVALNVYGPTETTVDATWARIEGGEPTIGLPLANMQVHVLDPWLAELPQGAVGECCIAGDGVARGYLNRPELEAERFVARNVDGRTQRLYRSGDLVRWSARGQLVYVGRRDTQVKLRGYRIELGEIEHVLREHAAVSEAAVTVSPTLGVLVGYVVGTAPRDAAELGAHCAARLPGYMVPSLFVALERLPLTRNGKLDLRALPEPASASNEAALLPASPTEVALAGIWSEILGRSGIAANADFFALGGHSLLAIRVISAIRERLGVELALATFFERPTIAQLAAAVDGMERGRSLPPILRAGIGSEAPLSFAQHRLWMIDRLEGGSPQYNMPAAFHVRGSFDLAACGQALDLLVSRHDILRTTYAYVDGRPVQTVNPDARLRVAVRDLTEFAPSVRDGALAKILRDDAVKPFDLHADSMLRVTVVTLSEAHRVLVFNMHHIASDGWSVSLLVREFVEA